MSKSGEEYTVRQGDTVEALLGRAEPRRAPPADDEQEVREAVRAEWQAVTGKYRARRQVARFAVAASVLLAAALTFNAFRDTGIAPGDVASIDKRHGSIYLLGEQSELTELVDLATVATGQIVVTGAESGIGLAWHNGGSLRMDEATIVDFVGADAVFLREGRVYFDSQETSASFTVETAHGTVSHLGTQYMTAVDRLRLTVSVREGEISIDRSSGTDSAFAGQQVQIVGGAAATITNIGRSGTLWEWVEATAPTLDFSGRSTYEFLHWVARETGYGIVFEDGEAERIAREGRLVGTIPGLDPRRELEVRMLGEDLDYAFDQDSGTIRVSSIDSGS